MNTIQEIERAIQALTPRELEELYSWLDQHCPQPIDARIQSDLAAGRLDKAINRALDDEKNGRVQPLLETRLHGASRHFAILAALPRATAAHPQQRR